MTPLISIVSGTFKHLESLKRMVVSVRSNIPRGISYEIVLVDGGSMDGSQDWCKAQPDIRLIEQGALFGAIKAFGAGARTARGEYVLLANDDIEFKPYSIMSAISHIESHPSCGAVAFADNRTSHVKGDGTQYRVEAIGVTLPNGEKTMVPYGQVALFRRTLGNLAGWWGDTDPIMSKAKTYGGDCYLSARLWEAGYTVDPDPLCVVEDYIGNDGPRKFNAAQGPADSKCYYTRYPTVHLPAQKRCYPKPPQLRILHLPVYETGYPQALNLDPGLTEALSDYGLVCEVDYLNDPTFNLVKLVEAWQPDLLITQIQGAGERITAAKLERARQVAPGMVVLNWCGDVHPEGLIGKEVIKILRHVDLQLTVNAKVLPDYAALGIPAAYHQIYFKEPLSIPEMPDYDVLLQANCYDSRRDKLVKILREIRGIKFGLYGNCKGSNGNTHYDFAKQWALNQNATIVIGDTFPGGEAFVSNRLFQALAAGAFLLQQHSEGLERYTGLKAGVHYIEWDDPVNLRIAIRHWMKPEQAKERKAIAAAGCTFVREHFSAQAQARKLFELLAVLEGNRELV